MSENLKKFLDMIASDKELEAKALACKELGEEKGAEAMLALAKEYGIELTAADLEKKAEPASRELDDDELDAVAGGENKMLCYCVLAGGGGGKDCYDGNTVGCACVGYGQGGDGKAKDANCRCIAGGAGTDDSINYFWQE